MTTFAPGKIAYLQLPALDVEVSASFYADVFGWDLRRKDGSISFDDTVGEVSGSWVTDRAPAPEPGLIPYILVTDVEATLARIEARGGSVVTPATPQKAGEAIATFRDPAGNVLGVFQE